MKSFVVAALCGLMLAGCGMISGKTGVPQSDVTVGYTLSPTTGQASFSAVSKHCGVLASGVANVDRGVAACIATDEGTALTGKVSGAVGGK